MMSDLTVMCKIRVPLYFTSPARRRPTEGLILMSESSGGVKQNSLGATGVTPGVADCLDWLLLVR